MRICEDPDILNILHIVKIFLGILLVITSLVFSMEVDASSLSASIVGDATFYDNITLYVQVSNLVGDDGQNKVLYGLVGDLNFILLPVFSASDEFMSKYIASGQRISVYLPV